MPLTKVKTMLKAMIYVNIDKIKEPHNEPLKNALTKQN